MPENQSLDRVIFDDLVAIGVPTLVGFLLTVGTPERHGPREESTMKPPPPIAGEEMKTKALRQAAEDREAIRRERPDPRPWTPEGAIERHRRERAGQG